MILNRHDIFKKQYVWSVLFWLVTYSICAQQVQITSDHIEIKYDKDFNREIQWK